MRAPRAHESSGPIHPCRNKTLLPPIEAKLYLEDHDWDVDAAVATGERGLSGCDRENCARRLTDCATGGDGARGQEGSMAS